MTPWQIKIRGEEVIPRSRLTANVLFPIKEGYNANTFV